MTSMNKALAFAALLAFASGAAPVLAQDGVTPAAPVPEQPAPPAAPDIPSRTIEAPNGAAQALQSPILTVDQDVLFATSAWGKRTQAVLEEEGGKIAADNERLADQLSAEEAELTEMRDTLDPAEFRKRAEAFDARATEVRRERAQAVQELNTWAETDRAAFYRAALPLMGAVVQERGAVAVLDRRTVFVSLDAIDVTADLVAQADQQLGDGADVVPFEPSPTPASDQPMPTGAAPDQPQQ